MKGVFRKLRGKKVANEAETTQRHPPPTATIPTSTATGAGQAQTRHQGQNSAVPTSNQSATTALPPPKGNTIRVTASRPIDNLPALLSQPLSQVSEDPRSWISIEPLPTCPVCYNFEAIRAPPDGSVPLQAWAHQEYQLSADHAIGKVTIDKSESLLDSAKAGCLYCNVLVAAVTASHPGWETEKSFVDLYLAKGLPVIVRLHFGSLVTVPVGQDYARTLGVEIGPDQQFNLIVTISDNTKPPVELEIYRPVQTVRESTIGGLLIEPLVQDIGFAEEIAAHPGDQACFDFINDNMNKCNESHQCARDGPLPLLPDRVLWVEANNTTRIQLVEPVDIHAPFLALSYCWGPVTTQTLLTTSKTIESLKGGINFEELPPLFRDVVEIARVLGIEYIWIDRLAILQGDDGDFRTQAAKMADIYGNATLTIAAASAESENGRILLPRDDQWRSYDLNMDVAGIAAVQLRFRRLSHHLGREKQGGEYGKISTRAWTWQERLISARTLFYTPASLKWECRCLSVWEGTDTNHVGHSLSAQLDDINHLTWTRLVEDFTKRDITKPSDRLPAMEGVMKHIEGKTGWSPFWGLWANKIIESLGWKTEESSAIGNTLGRMNPAYYAPTWSWASVDGPVSYVNAVANETIEKNDPVHWDLKCRSLNRASGSIRVTGKLIYVNMRCQIEASDTEAGGVRYKYDVTGSEEEKGFPVHADVPLKPWELTLQDQIVKTVIRVPYGETPPSSDWTSRCACLMISKQKWRCLVLFLGRSPTNPNAWERLGLVSGISPTAFENAQQTLVDII